MDTKFSVAVHILILISEAPNPLNSDQIAVSAVQMPEKSMELWYPLQLWQ